jgi:lipopolysaccharide transport system permease protein
MINKIWSYRGFILGSVRREFQAKYRNSLLGSLWSIIQPLSMIVVYTVIFANVMRAKLPGVDSSIAYSIYLCAGTLTWGLFAEITGRAQNVFIENANLIKKLNFPRICLPVVVILNAGLNFTIIFTLFTAFLALTGQFPGWPYLGVFPLMLLEVAFAIGLGVTLGVLNVFFRDVGQFFSVLLQFWFWFTPVVYPLSILPDPIRPWIERNPMTPLMTAYQDILVSGQWPQWETLWPLAVLALMTCALGYRLFRKRSGEMVDEL